MDGWQKGKAAKDVVGGSTQNDLLLLTRVHTACVESMLVGCESRGNVSSFKCPPLLPQMMLFNSQSSVGNGSKSFHQLVLNGQRSLFAVVAEEVAKT